MAIGVDGRGVAAGTLAYVAPEQIAGGPATPASDVYSATATFYECLTGSPPFPGDTAGLRQHQAAPVPLELVPKPVQPLVAAGMAKDPARRPGNALAFVTQLETAAAAGYGPDWHDRGRSHLAEAALLLAALWPAGPPPAVQGTAVHRVSLLRHLSPLRAALAVATLAAVAAGSTVLTGYFSHRPIAQQNPITPVLTVSLQPAPPPPPTPSPTFSPSLSPSPAPSSPSPTPSPPSRPRL
jgi:serine/threonine-protein kinase